MRNAYGRWAMMGVLVFAVAATGCKKKKTATGLGPDADIVGITGTMPDDTLGGGVLPSRDEFAAGAEQRGVLAPVYFDFDSAQINPAEQGKLTAASSYLSDNAGANLILEGHCDERGSNEYNLSLGERRAMAVRAYLLGLGVNASRIQTKSMGEEMPADPGHTEASWAKNRRGEFVVVGQ